MQIVNVNRNFSLLAFVLARPGTLLVLKCVTLRHFFAVNTCMTYEGGSKSFRPDQLSKMTEIKQLCNFSI